MAVNKLGIWSETKQTYTNINGEIMNHARFKKIIENSGKTLKEIASGAGISKQALDTIIAGGDFKVSTLEGLAKTLHVNPDYLIDGDEEVKVEVRGGKNIFLNAGKSRNVMNEGDTDRIKALEKTIAAQEMTISTQQMLIDLLTKTKSE